MWRFITAFSVLVSAAVASTFAAAQQDIKALKLSVVLIERPRTGLPAEKGSGFFVSENGHILTAAHVLLEGNESDDALVNRIVRVGRYGASQRQSARILSLNRLTDLALLKIRVDTPTPPLPLAMSSTVNPGDQLRIIGHPIDREEWYDSATLVDSINAREQILVQATLLEGQSGGPALNTASEVVGVVSSRAEGPGLSYLIPIGDSAGILAGLESNESVQAAGSSRATDMISPEVGISQIAALVGADEAEPNDDFANANVLQIADYDADLLVRVGGVLKGKDDFDLYQLTFTEDFGKSVKFVTRPKRAYGASIKIEVIDSSFSTLRYDSGYDPEQLELIISPNTNKPYYVKLTQIGGNANIEYDVFISTLEDS